MARRRRCGFLAVACGLCQILRAFAHMGLVTYMASVSNAHWNDCVVAFSSDSQWLAVGCSDSNVRIYSMNHTGVVQHITTLADASGSIESLAFSGDSKLLAIGSFDHSVRIYALDAVFPRLSVFVRRIATLSDASDVIESVAFSGDSKLLATGGDDCKVRIYALDPIGGTYRTATLSDATAVVRSVAISSDSRWLAAGGDDRMVRIYAMNHTGVDSHIATLSDAVTAIQAVTFSGDSKWLAVGDYNVRIYAMDNGVAQSSATLADAIGVTFSIVFSGDSKWLATGGFDSDVRIYAMDPSGVALHTATLSDARGVVSSVAFAGDSKWLAASGSDSAVRIYAFDHVGWFIVSASAACEASPAIKRLFGADGYQLKTCMQKCVETGACAAIDFYTSTSWCNLFDAACTTPTTVRDGSTSWAVAIACECPNGVTMGAAYSICAKGDAYACESCNAGYHKRGKSCLINKCKCPNGVAMGSGSPTCTKHDANACESCNTGYHKSGSSCLANICKCPRGTALPAGDPLCISNGATVCEHTHSFSRHVRDVVDSQNFWIVVVLLVLCVILVIENVAKRKRLSSSLTEPILVFSASELRPGESVLRCIRQELRQDQEASASALSWVRIQQDRDFPSWKADIMPNSSTYKFIQNYWEKTAASNMLLLHIELLDIPHHMRGLKAFFATMRNNRKERGGALNPDNINTDDFTAGLQKLRESFVRVDPNTKANYVLTWHGTAYENRYLVADGGLQPLRTTDGGFFGAGSYTTLNAQYAAAYSESGPAGPDSVYAVLLIMTCVGCAYIITRERDYETPDDPGGVSRFFSDDSNKAIAILPKYDTHFVPVKEAVIGHQACRVPEAEAFEIVSRDPSQCCPIAMCYYRKEMQQ